MEPFASEGRTMGVDLAADLDDARAVGALCDAAFRLAGEHGLVVFDPQLGRVVTKADEEEIRLQFERSSAFASGATTSVADADQVRPPSSLWVWLVLAGAVVLLYAVSRMWS